MRTQVLRPDVERCIDSVVVAFGPVCLLIKRRPKIRKTGTCIKAKTALEIAPQRQGAGRAKQVHISHAGAGDMQVGYGRRYRGQHEAGPACLVPFGYAGEYSVATTRLSFGEGISRGLEDKCGLCRDGIVARQGFLSQQHWVTFSRM